MASEDDKTDWGFTRRLVGRIPDVMSRALVAGTGALFLTEEGIRNLVSELKLPGDMVRALVQQADTTKKELFRFVGQEIRSFMEQSNLSQEMLKVLAGVTVELHTTIRFVPNEAGGVTPSFRTELKGGEEPENGGGEALEPTEESSEAASEQETSESERRRSGSVEAQKSAPRKVKKAPEPPREPPAPGSAVEPAAVQPLPTPRIEPVKKPEEKK